MAPSASEDDSSEGGCYFSEMKVALQKIAEMEPLDPKQSNVTLLDACGRTLVEKNLG
jgi:hypothetical protein